MECNKDEAVRAKEIAERKVTEKDYNGAKKFASKAQTLYPGLEGISQLLTTIDVYISAEKKINGEVDWYAILGTNPWVDDETVRKQYRKLVLVLHPDKNKSVGADGAFKLVSEAWSLLSDKAKRLAYNKKLNPRVQQKYPTQGGAPFASPTGNGIHTSRKNVNSHARTQKSTSQTRMSPNSVPSASKQNPVTFWTLCIRCKTQYEYLRIYLNHTLVCPNCREAFLAVERSPTPNAFMSPNLSSRQHHQNSRHHAANSNLYNSGGSAGLNSSNSTNLQWGPFSKMASVSSKVASATQTATAAQQAHEKLRREREEAQAAALKKKRTYDNCANGYGGNMTNQMSMGHGAGTGNTFEFRRGSYPGENIYGFSGTNNKPNSQRELLLFEIQNMLMDKARSEIRKKLKDWSSATDVKIADREKEKIKEKESRKQKSVVNGDLHILNQRNGSNTKNQNKDSLPGSSDNDSDTAASSLVMNVPDSDFHNFDLDRTASSFGDDQVWAAYDEDDGMPRYYARIHQVISLEPFKMKISWLNSRSNRELGPIPWIDSGFTKTCGDFRVGRHEMSETLNSFSHKVKWKKGVRGAIHIFPGKGDVWALYRNWSSDWDEHTSDEVIHKYDMVQVLDDFNEEQGVSVAPLVKVAGFRAVFLKHMDPNEVKRIPREEMFRFSHQVPGHLLTGQEALNAPAGSWELDPAAIPVEFLQVTTEANEDPLSENVGKVEEKRSQNATEIEVDEGGDSS